MRGKSKELLQWHFFRYESHIKSPGLNRTLGSLKQLLPKICDGTSSWEEVMGYSANVMNIIEFIMILKMLEFESFDSCFFKILVNVPIVKVTKSLELNPS